MKANTEIDPFLSAMTAAIARVDRIADSQGRLGCLGMLEDLIHKYRKAYECELAILLTQIEKRKSQICEAEEARQRELRRLER